MRKLLFLFILSLFFTGSSPAAQAYETTPILLPPVLDTANYRSPEIDNALLVKTRDHFKFPRYDVIRVELPPRPLLIDKTWLENQVAEHNAGGIVVIEIQHLRNYTRIISDDETVDETNLTLVLHFFDPKTGQVGKIKAERAVTKFASVFTGSLSVSLETMTELLQKLERIFPRTFPETTR